MDSATIFAFFVGLIVGWILGLITFWMMLIRLRMRNGNQKNAEKESNEEEGNTTATR